MGAGAQASNTRQWACDGKARFKTAKSATRHVRRMVRRSREDKSAPYLCQYCRWFHLRTVGR